MNTFSNNSYQCYFDNAATTRVRDEVAEKIVDVLKNNYGNPSSTHSYGRPSKSLIVYTLFLNSGILQYFSNEEIIFSISVSAFTRNNSVLLHVLRIVIPPNLNLCLR